MTKNIEKKKSKLLKKLKKAAKKAGHKIKKIKLGKRNSSDLRGLPVFDLAGWNKACDAALDAAEKEGIAIPRTAEEIVGKHITNRLNPIIANRKPWPTWPIIEAAEGLHKEFLPKDDADKVIEIKARLYDLLDIIERS